jgi:phage terminase small subunit
MLTNSRHEAFAQAVARGLPASRAYVEAGYKANDGNACRLTGNKRIVERVAGLKALVQNMRNLSTHHVVLNEAWVVEQLIGVVIDATTQDRLDSAGANKALHLLGLHLGMFVERKEQGKPGDFDGLTIESKRERVLSIMAQIRDGHFGNSHIL